MSPPPRPPSPSTTTTTTTTLLLPILLITFSLLLPTTTSRLTLDFYSKSCPSFSRIIQETITSKQITSPTTAAATLRLFFHDCFHPSGCDASILLSSTPFSKSERDADINLSLPGDAFDLIVRAKTALELTCPNTVSCADILVTATRDLITMVGGPYYQVYLGRRDTRVSLSNTVEGHLPRPNMTLTQLITLFTARGLSIQEMVALAGGHTIGFSHCKEFAEDVYREGGYSSYNARYAQGLKGACSRYKADPTLSVFNDIMTPNKFDNMYYQNLAKGLGLLRSDHALYNDPRTRPFVELYGRDQDRFFKDFARAMQKISLLGVMTGRKGEIRRRCDAIN